MESDGACDELVRASTRAGPGYTREVSVFSLMPDLTNLILFCKTCWFLVV